MDDFFYLFVSDLVLGRLRLELGSVRTHLPSLAELLGDVPDPVARELGLHLAPFLIAEEEESRPKQVTMTTKSANTPCRHQSKLVEDHFFLDTISNTFSVPPNTAEDRKRKKLSQNYI